MLSDDELVEQILLGNENAAEERKLTLREKMRENLMLINTIIFATGFIWTLIVLMVNADVLTWIILLIYVVQIVWIILAYLMRKKDWGTVYEIGTGMKMQGAFVRLYSEEEKRQLDVEMTDEGGRYGFRVEEGVYVLATSKEGYELAREGVDGDKLVESPVMTFVKADLADKENVKSDLPMHRA